MTEQLTDRRGQEPLSTNARDTSVERGNEIQRQRYSEIQRNNDTQDNEIADTTTHQYNETMRYSVSVMSCVMEARAWKHWKHEHAEATSKIDGMKIDDATHQS